MSTFTNLLNQRWIKTHAETIHCGTRRLKENRHPFATNLTDASSMMPHIACSQRLGRRMERFYSFRNRTSSILFSSIWCNRMHLKEAEKQLWDVRYYEIAESMMKSRSPIKARASNSIFHSQPLLPVTKHVCDITANGRRCCLPRPVYHRCNRIDGCVLGVAQSFTLSGGFDHEIDQRNQIGNRYSL